jgi:PAS domain S-box-containing protein
VLDSEGRIVYANDLWRDYTGYTLADDTPMGWLSILDMSQIVDVEGIWHTLNVEHLPVSYETRLLNAKGKEEPPYVMCKSTQSLMLALH